MGGRKTPRADARRSQLTARGPVQADSQAIAPAMHPLGEGLGDVEGGRESRPTAATDVGVGRGPAVPSSTWLAQIHCQRDANSSAHLLLVDAHTAFFEFVYDRFPRGQL